MSIERFLLTSFLLLGGLVGGMAQEEERVIDKIVAVVGDEVILKSDIENEFLHRQSQREVAVTTDLRSEIFEQLLIQKLLLAQAKIDSIEVTDDEVEGQLARQVEYYISQIGSEEKLENYFGKNLEEIKNDMRTTMREGMITQRMQAQVLSGMRVTPSEVRQFYRKLNKDSLPEMPVKYEIQQIALKPVISNEEKERCRNKLREYRDAILAGEKSFNTLAVLYSEDPGSAVRGGELGYTAKSGWTPEFAEAAFTLKPDKLSKIVETEYGFHLIQYIDRKGELLNVRHILVRPHVGEAERTETVATLDTIIESINSGKLSFEEAALYFSADKNSRMNGGLISNQNTDSRIAKGELKGDMARMVNRMSVGEISAPFWDRDEPTETCKIIRVKAMYPSHVANLDDDWNSFEDMLLTKKQSDYFEEWIKERQEATYIHIDEQYRDSAFRYSGWIK